MAKRGRPYSDVNRDNQIITLFRAGKTAVEIRSQFGLTVSGVCDVLKRHGVDRSEGGKSEIARQRAARRKYADGFRKAFEFVEKTGMNLSAFESLDALSIAHQRFCEQRMRANQRKIGWELSFADWWEIWSESGLWHMRGRQHANSAVMARRGDIGPYSVGNVYIITLSDNFVESWESAPNRCHGGRVKHIQKVSAAKVSTCF